MMILKDSLWNRKYSRGLSIFLFLLSLTQDCFCTDDQCIESIFALIGGSLGFLSGGAAMTWLANPMLFVCWLNNSKRSHVSFYAGLAASCMSTSFLFFQTVIIDEAGHYGNIVSYSYGYWLWIGSSWVMFLSHLIVYVSSRFAFKS